VPYRESLITRLFKDFFESPGKCAVAAMMVNITPTMEQFEDTSFSLSFAVDASICCVMGGLESDTIGGFNSMLQKQQTELAQDGLAGECRITTVLFDNQYEILHDRIDIKAVSPITDKEYFVRGNTALLDAIGRTIRKIGGVQKNTAEEYRAEKVLFVITTDGMENASREFDYSKIKAMIDPKRNLSRWRCA
jgi:hypothetical protein